MLETVKTSPTVPVLQNRNFQPQGKIMIRTLMMLQGHGQRQNQQPKQIFNVLLASVNYDERGPEERVFNVVNCFSGKFSLAKVSGRIKF